MILRAFLLEDFLTGRASHYSGPAIARSFKEHFELPVGFIRFPRAFFMQSVNLPHSITFFAGLFFVPEILTSIKNFPFLKLADLHGIALM